MATYETERKVYNFGAGPAVLPEPVLKKAAAEMLDYHGSGMSIMEVSHRGPDFEAIIHKAEMDLRTLLQIPANYKVLFVEGGATHQFSSIPMNLLGDKKEADYFVTGTWSKKAAAECARYGKVNEICNLGKYTRLPEKSEWKPFNPNASYVYYCDNETIEGIEFHEIPSGFPADVPLIADMSSNFLSKRVDVSKYGMIYACAQKNFGPAGLTVIIIREDLLDVKANPATPTIFLNKLQADNGSMYNTPSCYNIYIAGLVFEWILSLGGLAALEELNKRKAAKLYKYIDESGFYHNAVPEFCRSRMNVPFLGRLERYEKEFLAEAKKRNLMFLAGHRSVGGFRASIYNAMPEKGIDLLITFMKEFAAAHPAGKKAVLVVAEKPFAADAVTKIDAVAAPAGYDLLTCQGYKNVADLYKAAADAEAMIVRSDKVDEKLLEAAKKCKIIVRAGAGYDTIDLEACTKHGVVVMNTPGQNSNAVAELVFGMLLQAERNGFNGKSGCELHGRHIGLMGFGCVARCVAHLAKAFGMTISSFDPFVKDEAMTAEGVTPVHDPAELFKTCDAVSLHTPLTPETRGFVKLEWILSMKKGGVIVNTSRAEVVDDAVLRKALAKKVDFKYATDVISSVAFGKELQAAFPDRVFFSTVKSGAQTEEANTNAGTAAMHQIINFFEKGDHTFQVNK